MPRSPAPRTIWQRLKDHTGYLSGYHQMYRSAIFEELISQSFSSLLYLPFFDSDTDDPSISHKVTWNGSRDSLTKAPGGPDGIALSHGFSVVIEATLKSGTTQWSQEFAASLRHAENVSNNFDVEATSLFTILVTQNIHRDTYHSAKNSNETNPYKILPLELTALGTFVETAFLAFTLRHIEVRELFMNLLGILSSSSGLRDFRERSEKYAAEWQRKVLQLEKPTIIAVKSYEAMLKFRRDHVGTSEILRSLKRHPTIKWYFARVGEGINPEMISKSLLQESLGALEVKLRSGEHIFSPVPLLDFKSRCKRRLQAVEAANAI